MLLLQVQELLQQVSAVHARAAMVDTCKALLEQQPADAVAAHLQAALTLQGGSIVGMHGVRGGVHV